MVDPAASEKQSSDFTAIGVFLVVPGNRLLVRATPAFIRAEAGQVYLPAGEPPWVGPFVEELVAFTGLDDPHDDCVDVFAYAAAEMERSASPYITNLPPEPPRRTLEDQFHSGQSAAARRGLFGLGQRR